MTTDPMAGAPIGACCCNAVSSAIRRSADGEKQYSRENSWRIYRSIAVSTWREAFDGPASAASGHGTAALEVVCVGRRGAVAGTITACPERAFSCVALCVARKRAVGRRGLISNINSRYSSASHSPGNHHHEQAFRY